MKSNVKSDNLINFLYLCIPLFLITGPALPDIALTSLVLFIIIFKYDLFIRINKIWMIFFLILWVWFLIISFFAYNFEKSIIDALIYIRFILFIIFSFLIFKNSSIKFLKILLYFISICCVFVSVDTLFQFYNYDIIDGFGEDLFGRKPVGLYGRLSGPFSDLVPGSYISRLIFFIFILYLIEKGKFENNIYLQYLLYLVFGLMFSVIYLSGEKMAVATTMLGLAICLILIKNIRKLIIFSSLFTFFFIIANNHFHPHYKNYNVLSSTATHEGFVIERELSCNQNVNCKKIYNMQPKFIEVLKNFNESAYYEIYSSALHMWKDNKITGIGLNNFTSVCKYETKYKKYNQNFGCTSHPHNIYIQVLVETGVIGLIIFSIIIIYLFIKIYRVINFDLKFILISAYLSIFWPVMSTGSILKNWNMVFISFVLSLIIVISDNKNILKEYFK